MRRVKFLFFIILFLGVVSACNKQQANEADSTDNNQALTHPVQSKTSVLKVPTLPLTLKNWAPKVTGNGTIEHLNNIVTHAMSNSRVDKVFSAEGDAINFGDVLVRLSDTQLAKKLSAQLSVLENESDQFQQKLDSYLEHTKDTYGSLTTSERDLAIIQQIEVSRVALELADADYHRTLAEIYGTDVTSIAGGFVQKNFVNVGDKVGYRDPLFEIVSENYISARIIINAALNDLDWLGRACVVKSTAVSGRVFDGHVAVVEEGGGSETILTIVLRGGDLALLQAGMPVRAQCKGDWRDALVVIPELAIIRELNSPYVFLMKDGKAVKRRLAVAVGDGENTPVIMGLKSGDQLIIGKTSQLEPGMQVDVLEWIKVGVRGDF